MTTYLLKKPVFQEKHHLPEAQNKNLKITFMNLLKNLKKQMNEYLNEDCKNTESYS